MSGTAALLMQLSEHALHHIHNIRLIPYLGSTYLNVLSEVGALLRDVTSVKFYVSISMVFLHILPSSGVFG
jgi:hypothetical protein